MASAVTVTTGVTPGRPYQFFGFLSFLPVYIDERDGSAVPAE